MEFKNEQDVLRFFEGGGDMLDTFERTVYIADVNGDGEFFGIMVACDVPVEECGSVEDACDWALANIPAPGTGSRNRMDFMYAPGSWFATFADDVVKHPDEYMSRAFED